MSRIPPEQILLPYWRKNFWKI